jgi:phosphopantothenate-cysteine ligase/phosphopantothenoylcysteine decarboxylase/phosphopantothenate--cysteine ligase
MSSENFMNILVTAGNTQTPIDKVRCLTNIFTGKTGTRIALEAQRRGHSVTLFTSHPEIVTELAGGGPPIDRLQVKQYRTFDDLSNLMEAMIPTGGFDAIIHGAAVSDYALGGVYAKRGDSELVDVAAGKVKSSHAELWLKLVPTPKLVDRIRRPWGFAGTLVKFKLEVGLTDQELLAVAEGSRIQSNADLMVANTLEGRSEFAFVGPVGGKYERVDRADLPRRLIELLSK